MEAYIVKITDLLSKKQITLPMTPRDIGLTGSVVERGFTTIVTGDKPRPKGRSAYEHSFSGIIPDGGFGIPEYSDLNAIELEELLRDWQDGRAPYNKRLRLIVSDTTVNELVYLKGFSIDYSGGGRMINYELNFTEWRDFEVKVYEENKTSTEKNKRPTPPKPKVHVIKKGENLTMIARKYTKNNAKWKELYDLNRKNLRSGNPNLIFPGEKLTLPSGWLK